VRVLLDECLPRQLASHISDHAVETVTEEGWSGLTNAELLASAAGAYDVLVTLDLGFEAGFPVPPTVGVVVLPASTNRIDALRPLLPSLREALATVRPGQSQRVRN
jgi:predicted nuclease of predicted toxin-antitoxin system